jgi:putative colanic acid biosynthesis acetyltransferase WcaB
MDVRRSGATELGLGALLRADLAANRGNAKGRVVVTCFRLAGAARGSGRPRLWAVPVLVLYRLVVDWTMGIDLPPTLQAGPGLRIWHGTGLVVHANVRLGRDVTLRHGTTLGATGDEIDAPAPVLGDGVDVGAGAIVLGDLTVGAGAVIGAGSVVVGDVPAGATVVGNPARVLG